MRAYAASGSDMGSTYTFDTPVMLEHIRHHIDACFVLKMTITKISKGFIEQCHL